MSSGIATAGLVLLANLAYGQSYSVSTFAGNSTVETPISARSTGLLFPWGMAADSSGNVYFTMQQCCVYKISAAGVMTLVAGNGTQSYSGDGGPAVNAGLDYPVGLAVSTKGELYIADFSNARIRKVGIDGIISTVAGNGYTATGGDGGPAVSALLSGSTGVAVGPDGSFYITDGWGAAIRRVTPDGIITTVAGTGTLGFSGDGGPAVSAELNGASGIAVDGTGNLYILDALNDRIRRVSSTGTITTIAGNGTQGFSGDGGPAAAAQIALAASILGPGIAADSAGNLFFSDFGNNRVREISASGTISTAAGTGAGLFQAGSSDNPAAWPYGVAVDNLGSIYFIDGLNLAVRKLTSGTVSTIAGDGGNIASPDGGPAAQSPLNMPLGVTVAPDGSLYIADTGDYLVRRVSPEGKISTIAGNGTYSNSGDGGAATAASVTSPFAVAFDAAGNTYVAETYSGSGVVRKIEPDGTITTAITSEQSGLGAVGGMAVDASGNVYLSDGETGGSCSVRKVAPAGKVTLVAGNGTCGFSGDGGPATGAQLNQLAGLALDPQNNLYIADLGNNAIRKVAADGMITTLANYNSGGLVASRAVALDAAGNIYVSDANRIYILPRNGALTPLDNTDLIPSGSLSNAESISVDGSGNVYFARENGVDVLRPLKKERVPRVNGKLSDAATKDGFAREALVLYGAGFTSGFNIASSGSFPTQLAGTSVYLNGVAAPLLYATPGQIGVIAPFEIAGAASVSITVEYQGQTSDPLILPVASAAPGIFTVNETGSGQVAAVHTDGTFNSAVNPVARGGYVSLFGAGFGQSSPAGVDGQIFTNLPSPQFLLPVAATIGGAAANVVYAGFAPDDIDGIVQLNLQVPEGIQTGGYVPVTVSVGGTPSQGGLTIAVK